MDSCNRTHRGCARGKEPAPRPRLQEPVTIAPAESAANSTQALAASADEPVATVGGISITRAQLQQPLIEAYGLNILLNLVQLELAKAQAQRAGITVSDQDIHAERDLTLGKMFKKISLASFLLGNPFAVVFKDFII